MAQLRLLGTIGKGETAIDVYGDIPQLARDLSSFNRHGVKRALRNAINKAGDKTRTLLKKKIRTEHNLPAKLVNRAITTVRARPRDMAYTIKARGPQIPISKVKGFNPKTAQKALGVSINTGTGRRIIRGAFVATMPSGHVGVFVRKQQMKPRQKKVSSTGRISYPGLKIRELRFPSVGHMLTADDTANEGYNFFEQQFSPLFGQQLQREINIAQRKIDLRGT